MSTRLSKRIQNKQELPDRALQQKRADATREAHIAIDGVGIPNSSDSASSGNLVILTLVSHSDEEGGGGNGPPPPTPPISEVIACGLGWGVGWGLNLRRKPIEMDRGGTQSI